MVLAISLHKACLLTITSLTHAQGRSSFFLAFLQGMPSHLLDSAHASFAPCTVQGTSSIAPNALRPLRLPCHANNP